MGIEELKKHIRDVPDFPKPGILFKDITPLLADTKALEQAVAELAKPFAGQQVDKVVGLESRGFIFGPAVAMKLGAGFVPIRKPGKLPYKTKSQSYELEYGTDTIEVHEDAMGPGEKILVVDDLIATGGTAKAAEDLITQLGSVVVGFAFLVELDFLKGRQRLGSDTIHSVMHF